MKKMIFLALAMIAFSGCDKANSAECPDLRTEEYSDGSGAKLYVRARDDISIHNIIVNRGNCLYVSKGSVYRNGIDKMLVSYYRDEPLTSDYIEQSTKNEKAKEEAYKELNAGPKKLSKNIDLKFGEERFIVLFCKPLEVVFETNLGQCEYKF